MGGKKGGGSRSPRIDKNTLNSAQKLKVVDLISSGEIAGFINGNENPLKSVYLNDTPVQNEDGSMNHAGVQFEFNNGAIDQDYLPSLSSIDNSVSVGVEVEKKNPITRTVTNQQVTSVRVTVGVDALMRSTKEGDQLATSVDMSIQIIKNGNIYASEHMHLNEKGNQPFRLDYVFSNLPAAPFDIRCVRITEDSNDDMLRNKTYFFSYVESIDIKVRMPGSAVAMLQIDSQQFGSNNPTRNYGINGCIVQVPSNYDPVTRTYTGTWDRLFKPAFTNNPAWVLYDVLTADECLGEKFKDYRIDIDRLYELSKYSDSLVDDGNGGKEPRFVCNMVLFGDDASTVLDNICSIFRGTYSSANNHFTVQFDQKSDPVAVYNNSSVENGEFNYSYVPATELFNQIKVEYIDKDDGYRTKIDEVSDESNIAKYGLKSTSITAFGATKRSYALRCAKWNLVTALTENETVTFVLGAAGIRHEQHDIIKIADNDYTGAQIGGRIDSVDGNIITVDRELKNIKEFMINIDGSVKTFQVIKAIDAKTYQLDSAVNAVDYVQFVATLNNLEPRLFRCIHIEEDSEINKYTVTAIKHNPQKEAIVDKGAEYIEGNHSILNTLPHLSNGIVTTEGKAIILRWDSLETIGSENKYIVHLYNGTTLVRRIETKETFVRLENLPQGNYTARIRAINQLGQYSEELHISFSTTYEISGLRFNALPLEIHLFWQVSGLLTNDAVTEIWMSKKDDFTTATLFAKTVYPQSDYRITGLSVGDEFYFWFRLVDLDGNQGEFTRALKAMPSSDPSSILGILDGEITSAQISQGLKDQFEKDIAEAVEVATDGITEDLDGISTSITSMNADDMLANIALRTEGETRKQEDSKLEANTANNSASIAQLDTVVTDEFKAIAEREVIINAKVDTNEAAIKSVSQTVADNEKAQAIINEKVNTTFEDNEAEIQLSNIALSTEGMTRAQNDIKLSANVGLNSAEIETIQSIIVTDKQSQAQINTSLQSQVATNKSAIESVQSTIATDKSTQAQINTKLESDIAGNKASISTLNQTFVNEKQAQAQINQSNTAKFNDNEAEATLSSIALATEGESRAQNDSKLGANVGINSADIKRIDTVIVDNEKAVAQSITALNSKVGTNEAAIKSINNTIVTDKQAQAQTNTSLKSQIDTNTASVQTLSKTVTDNKSAQAQVNTSLTSQIGANTASITDIKTTTTTIDGKVNALYTMKVDANGNIAGMMLGANEFGSMVKFSADKFVVATADQSINMFAVQTINGKQVAHFNVDDLIAKGTVSGDKFIAGTEIQAPIIKGGEIDAGKFTGGSINIKNNFIVTGDGDLSAKNGYFGGKIEATEIIGDVVSLIRLDNREALEFLEFDLAPEKYDRYIYMSDFYIRFRRDGAGGLNHDYPMGRIDVTFNNKVVLTHVEAAGNGTSKSSNSPFFDGRVNNFNGSDKNVVWRFSGLYYFLAKNMSLNIKVNFTEKPREIEERLYFRIENSAFFLTMKSKVI